MTKEDTSTGKMRLLLVEDDIESGETLKAALLRKGVETTLVADGEKAIEEWTSRPFDAIVADIRLEGMNGVDLLVRVRERDRDFPFILITGYDIMEAAIKAVKLGAQDYILKPLDNVEALLKPVERAVKSHRLLIQNRKLEADLRQSESQFRALAARLESVREDERTRLSRMIHDKCGHTLTVLKMDLSWLAKQVGSLPESDGTKPMEDRLREMIKVVDGSIGQVRNLASELRPGLLDNLGLGAAIEWQGQEFQTRFGVKCVVEAETNGLNLSEEVTTGTFRIFQEILTNVSRHARATRVAVSLRKEGGNLVLRVRDNGVGITEQQIVSVSSLGLLGMRERARILGGKCEVSGERENGTAIVVEIPLTDGEDVKR